MRVLLDDARSEPPLATAERLQLSLYGLGAASLRHGGCGGFVRRGWAGGNWSFEVTSFPHSDRPVTADALLAVVELEPPIPLRGYVPGRYRYIYM